MEQAIPRGSDFCGSIGACKRMVAQMASTQVSIVIRIFSQLGDDDRNLLFESHFENGLEMGCGGGTNEKGSGAICSMYLKQD